MINYIQKKILATYRCTGIEVKLCNTGEITYSSITLARSKNRIRKEAVSDNIQYLEKKTPISVVFTGKGIFVKKIAATTLPPNPLSIVFPQANPGDFYYRSYLQDNHIHITIARKTTVDPIITELENLGYTILDLHLGFPVLDIVTPLIGDKTLILESASLVIKNQVIENSDVSDPGIYNPVEEHLLGDQYIQAKYLLAYAAASTLFVESLDEPLPISDSTIIGNRSNFIYRKYFRSALLSLVGILFIILLINYFTYTHYFKKNQELSASFSESVKNEKELTALNDKTNKEGAFIYEAGWQKQSKTSFLADRFAGMVPEEVWLTSMIFYPQAQSLSSDEKTFRFKRDTILLHAACTDAAQINIFINNLKTLRSVRETTMKSYTYNKTNENGEFILEIITQ